MLPRVTLASHQLETCSYVLKKKRRRCRMQALIGESFCGEHIVASLSGGKAMTSPGEGRVLCPLDPSHTCFASRLASHLRRCNARVPAQPPSYFRENINAGEIVNGGDDWGLALRSVSDTHLIALLSRIDWAYKEYVAPVIDMFESHPVLETSLQCSEFGTDTIKHLRQNSSLIGILDRCRLLNGESTYVELGSGKARLSYWLACTLPSSARVLLVDRASHRHKAENRLRDVPEAPRVDRLKIDIRHLALSGCEACAGRPVVALGKHLCGAASDLAIRALTNSSGASSPGGATSDGVQLAGMLIALCCHHRVEFDSYVGREFLLEQCGLSISDLNCLKGIAAWATCGTTDWTDSEPSPDQSSTDITTSVNSTAADVATSTPLITPTTDIPASVNSTAADVATSTPLTTPTTDIPASVNSTAAEEVTTPTHLTTPTTDITTSVNYTAADDIAAPINPLVSTSSFEFSGYRYRRLGLAPSRRTDLGMKCKRLLDTGRLHYLRERGISARLVHYVPDSVSPENVALLAGVPSD